MDQHRELTAMTTDDVAVTCRFCSADYVPAVVGSFCPRCVAKRRAEDDRRFFDIALEYFLARIRVSIIH